MSFATQVNASIQVPAAGSVRGFTGDTETFSPELASTFTNLFTTIFGRRIGTTTDSTPRVSANVGVAQPSDLTSGQRDVTLTSEVFVRMKTARGSHTSGPTLDNLAKYAFAVHPTTTSEFIANYPDPASRRQTTGDNFSRDQYTIDQWGTYRINQVSESDGSGGYRIPSNAFTTKVNVMPPSEIYIDRSAEINAFDNTFITFDDGVERFDEEGTPRETPGSLYTSFDEQTATSFDETGPKFDLGV